MAIFSSKSSRQEGSGMTYSECWKIVWQPRVLCQIKLFFKKEGKSETFPGKGKLKEFITSKPSLEKWKRESFKSQLKKQGRNLNTHEKIESTSKGNYTSN